MNKKLQLIYLLLLLPLLLLTTTVSAQRNRNAYTGNNSVLVTLDGFTNRYEFKSEQTLVRYNKDTQQIECIIPVETLLPLRDTIPPSMAYDVLFGAVHPQIFISFAAPTQQINAANLSPENVNLKTYVRLQEVTNSLAAPVIFTPESTALHFSTTLDLQLSDFQASIPVAYLPLLTGRMMITIDRARWVKLNGR
ncbi:hypothetical protein [uncultured Pontibacter sp.]|uniref:hypothetical protein n=1 Tax=uncultured Pontibacter sp. TaxID=453356 RepID=UPI00260E20FF|nr:hypothetical protein [uncultured Pontibacter sp.]